MRYEPERPARIFNPAANPLAASMLSRPYARQYPLEGQFPAAPEIARLALRSRIEHHHRSSSA